MFIIIADGDSSALSLSFPTTLTSCQTPCPSAAHPRPLPDTGLTMHTPSSCLGCFTLCQRQQPQQPCLEQTNDATPADVNSLIAGLKPTNLMKDASRPETPVDKWEGESGGPAALTGAVISKSDEGRVLLRKEIIRYVHNLSVPILSSSSESGKEVI